jgi:hypothetical protein
MPLTTPQLILAGLIEPVILLAPKKGEPRHGILGA